jgi:hypothetical protein
VSSAFACSQEVVLRWFGDITLHDWCQRREYKNEPIVDMETLDMLLQVKLWLRSALFQLRLDLDLTPARGVPYSDRDGCQRVARSRSRPPVRDGRFRLDSAQPAGLPWI